MSAKTGPRDLPPGCDRCKGDPHVVGAHGGAIRCECARGRELRAYDEERKAGSPAGAAKLRQREAAKSRKRLDSKTAEQKTEQGGLFEP